MNSFKFSVLIGALAFSSSSFAGEQFFELDAGAPTGISFSVYAKGKGPGDESLHTGTVKRISADGQKVKGRFIYNSDAKTLSGTLEIPITTLDVPGGLLQKFMDCHVRQTLGVAYDMNTHKVDGCAKLTGKLDDDKPIVYPTIKYEFNKTLVTDLNGASLTEGLKGKKEYLVEGFWTIHGVKKPGKIKFLFEDETEGDGHLYVSGSAGLRFPDFNMYVIPLISILELGGLGPDITLNFNRLPLLPAE